MLENDVGHIGFMLPCSLHYEFASFSSSWWDVQKMALKIDPILLNLIHLVPDFNFVVEFSSPVNNCVGDVNLMDLGVQGYIQFLLF